MAGVAGNQYHLNMLQQGEFGEHSVLGTTGFESIQINFVLMFMLCSARPRKIKQMPKVDIQIWGWQISMIIGVEMYNDFFSLPSELIKYHLCDCFYYNIVEYTKRPSMKWLIKMHAISMERTQTTSDQLQIYCIYSLRNWETS